MPILSPTAITGRVTALLLNPDRDGGLETRPVERVEASLDGFVGDCHSGATRRSCSRVVAQYPKGTVIRNTRQVSILSVEELAEIGAAMELPLALEPGWIGGNVVLSGIPQLTRLPPGARLVFSSGASLVVDMENGPCRFAGEAVDRHCPGRGRFFVKAALGRRGVTGWVERPGAIAIGDEARLHVPPVRIYEPAMAAVSQASPA